MLEETVKTSAKGARVKLLPPAEPRNLEME